MINKILNYIEEHGIAMIIILLLVLAISSVIKVVFNDKKEVHSTMEDSVKVTRPAFNFKLRERKPELRFIGIDSIPGLPIEFLASMTPEQREAWIMYYLAKTAIENSQREVYR